MKNEYTRTAERYAEKVIGGEIPACKWARLACKRHEDDRERARDRAFPYVYDEEAAGRVCAFIERLTHVKGERAGRLFKLAPWQVFVLCCLFGWKQRKNGRRRFARCYLEVPRGNGKSALCSAVALYMLCADGEAGADVYSFATTREQAREVFDTSLAMVRGNKPLRDYFAISPMANSIAIPRTNSKFQPKSSEKDSLDGLNTHCAIIDELHAHKDRGLYDVVLTSTQKRAQPLIFCITTAGFNLDGICMEVRGELCAVLTGEQENGSLFGMIYGIDPGDDWQTWETFDKANPNAEILNHAVIESIRGSALRTAAARKNYLTKYLDVWTNANTQWLDMDKYQLCEGEFSPEDFAGQWAIYGLDLAAKLDLSCVGRLFWKVEGGTIRYWYAPVFFLPEEQIKNNPRYQVYRDKGEIVETEGVITDINYIEQFIIDDAKKYQVLAVAFDPWNAAQISQNLMDADLPAVEVPQTVKNRSLPMKEIEAAIWARRIVVQKSDCMRWCAANVVCHTDTNDNIVPRKERNENKIDGMIALIMCMQQAIQLDVKNNYGDDGGDLEIDFSKLAL